MSGIEGPLSDNTTKGPVKGPFVAIPLVSKKKGFYSATLGGVPKCGHEEGQSTGTSALEEIGVILVVVERWLQ